MQKPIEITTAIKSEQSLRNLRSQALKLQQEFIEHLCFDRISHDEFHKRMDEIAQEIQFCDSRIAAILN